MTVEGVSATVAENDEIVTTRGTIRFLPASQKTVTMSITGKSLAPNAVPCIARLRTTASAGAAVALSFDETTEAFTYSHAGTPASYSVEFSSYGTHGKAVVFTPPALAVGNGDVHTFAPNWADLASGAGTLSERHSDGTNTIRPLGRTS